MQDKADLEVFNKNSRNFIFIVHLSYSITNSGLKKFLRRNRRGAESFFYLL